MLNRKFLLALFILSFIPLSASALSQPSIVSLENVNSVEEGVAEISNTLESQGLEIVLTVDHSANAASVDLDLPPTTVIFARLPKYAEKALLREGTTVAIDLPIKFLVFEQDDEILLATNSVGYLVDRHTLRTRDFILNAIGRVQNQFNMADNGLVTIQSTRSIHDTAQSIQDALIGTGLFAIPLVLDFGDRSSNGNGNGHGHGNVNPSSSTSPVLIVFGNAAAGTPLMQSQRSIGIDLPQKFLIWQDKSGVVNITYNDPFFLADRHSIEDQDARLATVAGALNNFATIGAGR